MKRIPTVLLASLILLSALLASPVSSWRAAAQETNPEDEIALIVQTDGPPQALSVQVENLGGNIEFVYENVPAMVVNLPAAQEGSLAGLPGVAYVEKDRLVYLADEAPASQDWLDRPMSLAVADLTGVAVAAVNPAASGSNLLPAGFVDFTLTDVDQIWEQTGYGSGSVVAVVDTGTAPNVCLSQTVIGAPGFPEGFNATTDGIPANSPQNHWHGTHVGGVIASACALDFSAFPDHPLYRAISSFLPWPVNFVPVFGQAPLAQVYPVKVFDVSGGGTPTSVVLKGLDHVLSLKKSGQLDIDVVNLSLSRPSLFDGRDAFDRFLKELNNANITVVSAASNFGPIPNSIGSPGTSFATISVGALDYAAAARVFYEYSGLISPFGSGQGMLMRPTKEARVANFSARGPMSDGRAGPDLTAPGVWTFQAGPQNELRWASGTSFAAPNVSGVAALLNAYYENKHARDLDPLRLRNALLLGVDPWAVGKVWRGQNSMGYGAVDGGQALRQLRKGNLELAYPPISGQLGPNMLGDPVRGQTEVYTSESFGLRPGRTADAILTVAPVTSKVIIEVTGISAPNNSATAIWPNNLEVYVQNARRSAVDPVLAFDWHPYRDGSKFTIVIEDGIWSLNGEAVGNYPMQPGLVKLTLAAGPTNSTGLRLKLRVTRENMAIPLTDPVAQGAIDPGAVLRIPVTIPEGVSRATFDLAWQRNWTDFPSSDLDMVVIDPAGQVASTAGTTLNSPERAILEHPIPGQWQILVKAVELYRPDTFSLYLRIE